MSHEIVGGTYTDSRGALRFCNDFDMSPVKRFYTLDYSFPSTLSTKKNETICSVTIHFLFGRSEISFQDYLRLKRGNIHLTSQ